MKRNLFVGMVAILLAVPFAFSFAGCFSDDETSEESTVSSGNSTSDSSTSDSSSSDSSTSNSTTDDSTENGTTALTDTSGNAISSGSANVSFKYGSQTTTVEISAAYLIDDVDVEITSGTYYSASGSTDQTVFLVINGGSLTITGSDTDNVVITKSGSAASGGQVDDNYNFYGINSGIVVAGNSSATISYADITTSANGANAVVATNGGSITISDSTITTTGSAGARGLHATYSGTITADNVTITTSGSSCASLATDRGGGTITAENMTLETNGSGSPLVYSTGTISVTNSTGTANKAQMVVVEGGSSASLDSCTFSCTGGGNRTGTSESNSSSHTIDAAGIFIYQSASGDAEDGTDYFTATDCSLTVTTSGVPMFYVTNITAVITLENNTFTQNSSSDYLFICEETNQWGSVGSNGGKATVSLTNQSLSGYTAFVGTSSSSLTITATDSSSTSITKTTGTW
ncbi:MAG: hypothetical protein LUF82_04220 [Clostridia bacterium]|nr:hypothetical protein [Clostridia bacterium]